MTILLWGCTAFICALVALFFGRHGRRREQEAMAHGTYARGFVFVNEDGSVRELTAEEAAFLNTEFHPADSGRPYIKSGYNARTPDGRLKGFLPRSEVPWTATWS
ncbi:MAG TPA: hypothetical protein VM051_01235 [Usitatibacter sp.]|nr:hypothetical protein [Usitatibacter sp.]